MKTNYLPAAVQQLCLVGVMLMTDQDTASLGGVGGGGRAGVETARKCPLSVGEMSCDLCM